MAVTVTPAAPSTAIKTLYGNGFGTPSTSVTADCGVVGEAKRMKLTKLALSGTYVTGGFALTPSAYGLKEIQGLLVIADGNSGGLAVPQLTAPGGSPVVKLVTDNVPTELTNGNSVTNHTYTVILIGV